MARSSSTGPARHLATAPARWLTFGIGPLSESLCAEWPSGSFASSLPILIPETR
jgi:hypothetical protein